MTKSTTAPQGVFSIDSLDDFAAADTAEMTVVLNGRPTDWKWTFAGPGHPKTVDQSNRIAREALHTQKMQSQARVNNKKWVAPEDDVEVVRARNVDHVVERLLGWSPIEIGGTAYPFTSENARALLAKPSNQALLTQAYEALGDDAFFTKR